MATLIEGHFGTAIQFYTGSLSALDLTRHTIQTALHSVTHISPPLMAIAPSTETAG